MRAGEGGGVITFVCRLRAGFGNAATLQALLTRVRDASRGEPGVIYYDFAVSEDDPADYVVIEVYRDAAAHAAHMETPWVTESLPRTMPLIEGTVDVRQYVTPGTLPAVRRFSQG